MEINYAQLSDAIDPQYRVNAGKLATIMAGLKAGQHRQDSWATVDDSGNNHVCGTPQCALGWGIHMKLTEGVELAVVVGVFNDYARERLRILLPTAQWVGSAADASNGYFLRLDNLSDEDYATAASVAAVGYADARAIRGNEWLNWEHVGEEFFGGAVTEAVFNCAELTTTQVVEALRCYEQNGFVDYGPWRYFVAGTDVDDQLTETDEIDHEHYVYNGTPHSVLYHDRGVF